MTEREQWLEAELERVRDRANCLEDTVANLLVSIRDLNMGYRFEDLAPGDWASIIEPFADDLDFLEQIDCQEFCLVVPDIFERMKRARLEHWGWCQDAQGVWHSHIHHPEADVTALSVHEAYLLETSL